MTCVLLVNLEGAIGGAETSLLLMAKYLRNEFHSSVACPADSPLWRLLTPFDACHRLPGPPKRAYRSPLSLVYWLRTSLCLTRIALRVNPDLIHANSLHAGLASILAAVVAGKRLLVHARDLTNLGFLSRLLGRLCYRVIAVSNAVKGSLISQGIVPEKIEVVYNGVDIAVAEPSGLSKSGSDARRPDRACQFVFGHVGQFVPWKKHIAFLEAACRVADELPHARFVLVGDDVFGRDSPYKRAVLSYVRSSKIADRVDLLGWQENMERVWAGIDCLVHTAAREPFGRVIIEAMANGIVVIAVDSCGPSEIVENGKTGVLVPIDDVEALSQAMLRIAKDGRAAGRLAEAGREHILSSFTAERTASRIADIYRRAAVRGLHEDRHESP